MIRTSLRFIAAALLLSCCAGAALCQTAPRVGGNLIHAVAGVDYDSVVGSFYQYPDYASYIIDIDWGDGTITSGTVWEYGNGAYDVFGGHIYARAGSYTTTVTVVDSLGLSGSGSGTAEVSDPSLIASGSYITATSTSFSGVVATFTDASPYSATDFTATVDWGDGTSSAGSISATTSSIFTVSGAHTYPTTGLYGITVIIRDAGGSLAYANTTISISTSSSGSGSGSKGKGHGKK